MVLSANSTHCWGFGSTFLIRMTWRQSSRSESRFLLVGSIPVYINSIWRGGNVFFYKGWMTRKDLNSGECVITVIHHQDHRSIKQPVQWWYVVPQSSSMDGRRQPLPLIINCYPAFETSPWRLPTFTNQAASTIVSQSEPNLNKRISEYSPFLFFFITHHWLDILNSIHYIAIDWKLIHHIWYISHYWLLIH